MSASAFAYAQPLAHGRDDLVALGQEWAQLDVRLLDLEQRSMIALTCDWIHRRQAMIRDIMLSTPSETMADVGAKHRVATAHRNEPRDEELLEAAENDVVRLVYG